MANDFDQDSRLRKDSGRKARGSREDADNERTQQDGSALSSYERRQQMAQEWVQEILPTPPVIAGMHVCWVSTTNSTDPVYGRLRKGYAPVKVSEVPGMELYKVTVPGDFEGCVQCNEMLLMKIPEEIYQDIMAVFHHDKPADAEMTIREKLREAEVRDGSGKSLSHEAPGFQQFGQRVPTPIFQ